MSEYQYYEFMAVDRPLTREQMSELRACSTRARITSTGFVNEYHFGSFKGNADAWMERYFDAFLYTANWGTNILKLRLPESFLDAKTAGAYCHSEHAAARAKDGNTILTFRSEEEEEAAEEIRGDGLLATMVPVRADLLRGDLRALYLGWLLSAQDGVLSNDDKEPPVPAGLNQLSASLESVREFLRIDADLVVAAGASSAPLDLAPVREDDVLQWIATLSVEDKDRMLMRVVTGDDRTVVIEMQRRYLARRREPAAAAMQVSSRTVGQLLAAARVIGEKRRRDAARRAEQERVLQERQAEKSRQDYLDMLSRREPQTWTEVEALLTKPLPRNYEAAVKHLVDLRDLAERGGKMANFRKQVERLRAVNSTRARFLERLDAAEL